MAATWVQTGCKGGECDSLHTNYARRLIHLPIEKGVVSRVPTSPPSRGLSASSSANGAALALVLRLYGVRSSCVNASGPEIFIHLGGILS